MTCIIGLVQDGTVYMGCDSAGSNGWTLRAVHNPKIFRVGECLIGYTSSFRMGQILQYHLNLPTRSETESDEQYMFVKFSEAVRGCLKSYGYATIESNKESGGEFLVGYRGHLYTMYSNFALLQHRDNIESVGCAYEVALGAMLALEGMEPEKRIARALEIAGILSNGVLPPYQVEQLDSQGGQPRGAVPTEGSGSYG